MTTSPDTAPLETRFSCGDPSALTEMYRTYSGPMFGAALSLLGDREMAADAVQRAFVQAWQAATTYDPARPLQPWLYAITRRAAIDIYRRERRNANQASLDESWDFDNIVSTQDPTFDQTWQIWQVRGALDKLSPDERTVLQLAYYDGYSQSEIAGLLKAPLGTIKSRTARAQRRLAALLTHLQTTPEPVPPTSTAGTAGLPAGARERL